MRTVALSFLAHPDDAEFLCAGTLARLSQLGWDVHIATATAGDCGSATLGPDEISRIRRQEGQAAAETIGATYHCLEERDLRVVYATPAIDRVIDLMRRVAPSVVFSHPRRDYMMDHEQAHLLARGATFAYAIPNATRLPLVEGSGVPHLYYCDPLEGQDPYTGETSAAETLVDISSLIDTKAQMLACHASQRDWLRAHHGTDEYIDSMKRHAVVRGELHGTEYAEAFVLHRGHPYPQNDLLGELLS